MIPDWLFIGITDALVKPLSLAWHKHMTEEDRIEKEGICKGYSFESKKEMLSTELGKAPSIACSQRNETIEILSEEGGFLNY